MAGSPATPRELVRGRLRAPRPDGLRRARLVDQLVGQGSPRLSLVVAPAGCGKTTLLSHVAEAAGPSVAWLTVDRDLASVRGFLAHLRASFAAVATVTTPPWRSATDALAALESGLPQPMLLVLDELHTIAGAPALEVVRLLLRHQPEQLSLALGARKLADLDIARIRLSGGVRDIGAQDLRFRTWEVEELFRTCHQVRLAAGEVSILAQRTAGWAAGLQLFHLATNGRPQSARAGLLAGGIGGGRLTSQYLAEQVLEQIPFALRDFVLRTSVLSRLSAARCDDLLAATGSADLLVELERSGLLTWPGLGVEAAPASREYRYHDVLQTHLIDQLEVRFGTPTARDLHRRAGALWQREAAYVDAVRSYCQAQDWKAVHLAIDVGGAHLAGDRGSWLDLLPASIHETDPWVALALARRLLADGAVDAATAAYGRAVTNFGGLSGAETAMREQRAVRAWADPPLGTVDDAVHQLRLALVDPKRVPAPSGASSSTRWCAHAVARLVSGQFAEALADFDTASQQPGAPAAIEALTFLGQAVAFTAMGHPGALEARRRAGLVAGAAELPVLERLADGLVQVASPESAPSQAVGDLVARCRACDDTWGEALLRLFAATHGLSRGRTTPPSAREAADLLAALPAPALAVWANVVEALASAMLREPWPREALTRLERSASAVGPLPHALALLATADVTSDPIAATRSREAARQLARRCGAERWVTRVALALPAQSRSTSAASVSGPRSDREAEAAALPVGPRIRVEVLGRFSLTRGGAPIPLDGVRPLHRELLRLFCVNSDRVVWQDQLVDWFWPGTDVQRGRHSLQVAVSELRRLLQPVAHRGDSASLRRDGAGYRLELQHPDDCDARRLENLVKAAEVAQQLGDHGMATAHLEAAVALYRGELLPSDGCAEWVLAERDRLREIVVNAHERLVLIRAAAGEHAGAAAAARSGLAQDRHRDGLWRQLVSSLIAMEEPVAAAAAQRTYAALMVELGVPGVG